MTRSNLSGVAVGHVVQKPTIMEADWPWRLHRERERERERERTPIYLCSELASPIEDFDLPEMQKNEEQNFVGINFINGKVSGREERGRERGKKILEKKMKWREI